MATSTLNAADKISNQIFSINRYLNSELGDTFDIRFIGRKAKSISALDFWLELSMPEIDHGRESVSMLAITVSGKLDSTNFDYNLPIKLDAVQQAMNFQNGDGIPMFDFTDTDNETIIAGTNIYPVPDSVTPLWDDEEDERISGYVLSYRLYLWRDGVTL